MKRFIVVLLLFVLLVGVVAAEVSTSRRPEIRFEYNEQVTLLEVSLTRNIFPPEGEIPVTIENESDMIFTISPVNNLNNGLYMLEVTAEDLVGNTVDTYYEFEVDAPAMQIWQVIPLAEPIEECLTAGNESCKVPFGLTNNAAFDWTMQSEFASACRYSDEWYDEEDPFFFWFYEFDNDQEEASIMHILNDAVGVLNLQDGEIRETSVRCETPTGLISIQPKVAFGYDTTSPVFNVQVSPESKIVRDFEAPLAVLTIGTDDPTVCTMTEFRDPGCNAEPVVTAYPDPFDIESYMTSREYVLLYDYVRDNACGTPFQSFYFNYTITCRNMAWQESTINETITLEFSREYTIAKVFPPEYHNYTIMNFTISTSQAVLGCAYDRHGGGSGTFVSSDGKTHIAMINVPSGRINFTVSCTSSFTDPVSADFSFFVDTEPPGRPTINASQYTCSLNDMEATASVTEDDVVSLEYRITNGTNDVLTEWFSADVDDTLSVNIDLVENVSYKWNVRSIDRTGNYGPIATKIVEAKSSSGPECDFDPPFVRAVESEAGNMLRGTNVTITCTDTSGCTDGFKLGISNNVSCTPIIQQYFNSILPQRIEQTTTFCWDAVDRSPNQNRNLGRATIEVQYDPSCTDGVKNGDESDVDCGGICQACDNNQHCEDDDDCYSHYCENNICTEPSCTDGVKNGLESDVDCGGICDACDLGKECVEHQDCISNYCDNGVCAEAFCDDGIWNGFETDVDCGADCDPCDIDQRCLEDADCKEGLICDYGICLEDPDYDSDEDGMPDWWEEKHFACTTCAEPFDDPDNDGLTNKEEYENGADPHNADTDDDGYKDSVEVEYGTDPSDPYDYPELPKSPLSLLFLILGVLSVVGGAGFWAYKDYFSKFLGGKPAIPSAKTPVGKSPSSFKQKIEFDTSKKETKAPAVSEADQKKIKDLERRKWAIREKKRSTLVQDFSGEKPKPKISLHQRIIKPLFMRKQETSITKEKKTQKEDIFEDLGKIARDKKTEEKLSVVKKKSKSKDWEFKIKKGEKKDVFDDLDDVIKGKKTKKTDENAFKELSKITQKPTKKSTKKKGKIDRKEIVQMLSSLPSKTMDKNVFKEILVHLMDAGKINKEDVHDILFGFVDEKLMTKEEAGKIVNDIRNMGWKRKYGVKV